MSEFLYSFLTTATTFLCTFSYPVQFSPLSSPSSPCDNGKVVSAGKKKAKYNTHLTLSCQAIFVSLCFFFGLVHELNSRTWIFTEDFIYIYIILYIHKQHSTYTFKCPIRDMTIDCYNHPKNFEISGQHLMASSYWTWLNIQFFILN